MSICVYLKSVWVHRAGQQFEVPSVPSMPLSPSHKSYFVQALYIVYPARLGLHVLWSVPVHILGQWDSQTFVGEQVASILFSSGRSGLPIQGQSRELFLEDWTRATRPFCV